MIKWPFLVLVEQPINKKVLNITVPIFIQKNKTNQKARLIIFICAIIRHVDNLIYGSVLLKG